MLVVASVFPANMACAKVSYPTWAVGLPRSLPWMPTTARPWVGQLWGLEWQEISERSSASSWVLSSLQPGLARPRKERMLKVRGQLQ